jgi:hypothetical protein
MYSGIKVVNMCIPAFTLVHCSIYNYSHELVYKQYVIIKCFDFVVYEGPSGTKCSFRYRVRTPDMSPLMSLKS